MAVENKPSKWWQFEQRVRLAWKNRKTDTIKEPMSSGNKVTAATAVLGIASVATSYVPVLGSFFVSPILNVAALIVGVAAARHYSRALYNDKMDKAITKKIENYKRKPTPSYVAKFLGNSLKYTVGTARIVAGIAAVAGLAVGASAAMVAFGSATLAGTAALSIAGNTLAVASAVTGISNIAAIMAAGTATAVIAGAGAIKGKTIVNNIGKKLQKSAEEGRKTVRRKNAGFVARTIDSATMAFKGLGADIFNVAAQKQAKKIKKDIKNAVSKQNNPNTP